jgi:hypothetical protein
MFTSVHAKYKRLLQKLVLNWSNMAFCPQGYTAFILFIIHEAVWGFFVSYILFSACLVSLQLTWFRQTQLDTKHVLNVIPLFFLILFVVFLYSIHLLLGWLPFLLYSPGKNCETEMGITQCKWVIGLGYIKFQFRCFENEWVCCTQWGTILSPRKTSF